MDPSRRVASADRIVFDGVVLAAGRSERMGRPKALLPVDAESFLQRCIRVLQEGGCRGVIAVVPADAPDTIRLAEQSGALVVRSRSARAEQIDSLRLGLRALEDDVAAAVVLPVDHPLVEAGTVLTLLGAFREGAAPIVRPVYRGVPGHPTIFPRRLFAELSASGLPHGARSVIEAHAAEVVDVPVEDAGVVADIDTPEDYRRLVEGWC
ncbi:MAG TPA: nucleotidyltransferase family protein [Longimicrobiales bacterium]